MNIKKIWIAVSGFIIGLFHNLPALEKQLIDESIQVTNWLKAAVNSAIVSTIIDFTPTTADNEIATRIRAIIDSVLARLLELQGDTPEQRNAAAVEVLRARLKDDRDAFYLKFAAMYVSHETQGTEEPIKPSRAISIVNERYAQHQTTEGEHQE